MITSTECIFVSEWPCQMHYCLLCLMDPAAQWFAWKKAKVFNIFIFSLTIDNRKDWEDPQDKQRFSRAETRAQEVREEQAIRWYARY